MSATPPAPASPPEPTTPEAAPSTTVAPAAPPAADSTTAVPTPMEPVTPVTPTTTIAPKSHKGWWAAFILLLLVLLGLGWYYYFRIPATPPANEALVETKEAADPVDSQLSSVSTATDSGTLAQELSDTDLEDLGEELDSVTVEASGL